MINGIINIYKEAGFTSHDVVAKMRGILKQKKIGHTGTLDPAATGVLPVCLGNGTKLCDLLTDKDKEYRAVLRLGVRTDTQDMTGTVLSTDAVELLKEDVEEVINSFVGEYNQIPPMYSALKVNGKKLYELAREGKEVERASRAVCINYIEIHSIELPLVTMTVGCSKGTYIRTLCYDIGEKLGCGGTMESLQRTKVGPFSIGEAITLSQLEALRDEGCVESKVVSVPEVFKELPVVHVKKEWQKKLDNGNTLFESEVVENDLHNEKIRIYSQDNRFFGIYEYEKKTGLLKPFKMFLPAEDK